MRKTAFLILFLSLYLLSACSTTRATESALEPAPSVPETTSPAVCTDAVTLPPVPETTSPVVCTDAVTLPSEPETSPASAESVITLADKDKTILLKLAMAERGNEECTTCIALVMRTVLNRAEAGNFGKNIRSVVFAENQFTPVADGSYDSAQPSERCYEALEMILHGWDESQGALYYEWCEGESWHSRNLELLFQHCDVRFYK